jgi:secreted Zn-dependent insulinase-like peptidase
LCDINKLNILLRSKQFENQTNEVEEWYQTKYSVTNFSEQLKQRMTNPNIEFKKSKLDLPPKNNLIPTNFDILNENPEYSETPKLLVSNKNYDLWYKKDDQFKRPKSFVSMKMYTPDCLLGVSPNSRVFINLWTLMMNEYLREFNYMANCANMNFEISPLYDSISL